MTAYLAVGSEGKTLIGHSNRITNDLCVCVNIVLMVPKIKKTRTA